jgi:hypothetical protein
VGAAVGVPLPAVVRGGDAAGAVAVCARPPDEQPTAATAKTTTAVRA